MRPPEPGVFHRKLIILFFPCRIFCRNYLTVRVRYRNPDLSSVPKKTAFPVAKQLKGNIKIQRNLTGLMNLCYVNRVQAALFNAKKRYIPEDTGIRQSWTPIPPKHTMGFAQMRKTFHSILGALHSNLLIFFLYILCRGMEHHLQLVISFPDTACFQQVNFPDSVHIVSTANLLTV